MNKEVNSKHFSARNITRIASTVGLIAGMVVLNTCAQAQNQPAASVADSRVTSTPTRPPWCKPLPTEPPITGTRTATPNILTPLPTPAEPLPTWTPYPTPHIIDLAPYLPFEDKLEVWVFRCNGDKDLVLVDPKDNPYQVIELAAGDVILDIAPPASIMGHEPPTPLPSPTLTTRVPSPNPYPFGTSTILPYPSNLFPYP